MKRSEYKKRLDFFIEKIQELKKVEIEEDTMNKSEDWDSYYCIFDEGFISKVKFFDTNNIYSYRLSIGNVFDTREEAEFQVERLKVIAELKQFSKKFEKNKDNFCIKYDVFDKELGIYNNYYYATGELCFASEKDAKDAIEFVGEDRVLKYYLGVEEK